ncbi:MAG: zinc-ribbon domain-containing protein [Terriglobia bacterium]
MVLLVGSTWRHKAVGDGLIVRRHCPECGTGTRFQEVRPTQFFTVFFVPVVKVSEKNPVLKCLRCESLYSVEPGEAAR